MKRTWHVRPDELDPGLPCRCPACQHLFYVPADGKVLAVKSDRTGTLLGWLCVGCTKQLANEDETTLSILACEQAANGGWTGEPAPYNGWPAEVVEGMARAA